MLRISRRFYGIFPERLDLYKIPDTPNVNSIIKQCQKLKLSIPEWTYKSESFQHILITKMKYEWTYHSNAIEGNKLSLEDTISFLKEGVTSSSKQLKDYLEAENHYKAMELLIKEIEIDNNIIPYTMKVFNAILLNGIENTPAINAKGENTVKRVIAGEYKLLPNKVLKSDGSFHNYVNPLQVSSQMDELFDWINNNLSTIDPIIVSAIAHYNFVRIHPFDDGNGRSARILMNLILLKHKYPGAVIYIQQKLKYFNVLEMSDSGNLEPFVLFICSAVYKQLEIVLEEVLLFEKTNH